MGAGKETSAFAFYIPDTDHCTISGNGSFLQDIQSILKNVIFNQMEMTLRYQPILEEGIHIQYPVHIDDSKHNCTLLLQPLSNDGNQIDAVEMTFSQSQYKNEVEELKAQLAEKEAEIVKLKKKSKISPRLALRSNQSMPLVMVVDRDGSIPSHHPWDYQYERIHSRIFQERKVDFFQLMASGETFLTGYDPELILNMVIEDQSSFFGVSLGKKTDGTQDLACFILFPADENSAHIMWWTVETVLLGDIIQPKHKTLDTIKKFKPIDTEPAVFVFNYDGNLEQWTIPADFPLRMDPDQLKKGMRIGALAKLDHESKYYGRDLVRSMQNLIDSHTMDTMITRGLTIDGEDSYYEIHLEPIDHQSIRWIIRAIVPDEKSEAELKGENHGIEE